MKRLILTFASAAYARQLRVFKQELERSNPSLELLVIDHLSDPTEMLRLRPQVILRALQLKYDQVIFTGADQIFFQSLNFDTKPSCILFPHATTPPPFDGNHPSIHDLLRTGTFNSDLQVWNRSLQAFQFLEWYANELQRECVTDFSRGLFLDQTYLNQASVLPTAMIDRSNVHNIAFYNLHYNQITKRDGTWYVNDALLGSFHYTGFDASNPARISRHQNRLTAEGDLLELMEWYGGELNK